MTGLPGPAGLLPGGSAGEVAAAFRAAGYTVDGVTGLVGADTIRALGRGEPGPLRRAVRGDDSPVNVCVRLFLVGDEVPAELLGAALPLDAAEPLLRHRDGLVSAAYDVSPHGDGSHEWWVVADRTDAAGRPQRRDHVLGIGGASTTLAQIVVRRPVDRALDLGTGCGVQALHLSTHCRTVTATDVLPRALALAATSFALSGVEVELCQGDLAEPVTGREFDLVVCNPPFVVGPAARFAYRDGAATDPALDGDEMSRRALRAAAAVLADGGVAHVLANWLHVRGEDWRDRVAGWVADLGCDAWLIQRDVQDPADYVSTWSGDAGATGEGDEAWLDWLAARDVDGVGFGWVLLRRAEQPHRLAVEEMLQPVDLPLGEAFGQWLDRTAWLRDHDDAAMLSHRFTASPALRLDPQPPLRARTAGPRLPPRCAWTRRSGGHCRATTPPRRSSAPATGPGRSEPSHPCSPPVPAYRRTTSPPPSARPFAGSSTAVLSCPVRDPDDHVCEVGGRRGA